MRLRKFNEEAEEAEETKITLRDLIGDIKETKIVQGEWGGNYQIIETDNGCFTNLEAEELEKYLDSEFSISKYKIGKNHNQTPQNGAGEITIRVKHGDKYYNSWWYVYFEGSYPKIISSYPGDERGCCVFNDVFIATGHDGNYLWDVNTGEFKSNTF